MEKLGKLVFFVITLIIGVVLNGFVLSKLWLWFVVPVFNIQTITILQAAGLSMIVTYFKVKRDKDEKDFSENVQDIIFSFFYMGLSLLFGFVLKSFM